MTRTNELPVPTFDIKQFVGMRVGSEIHIAAEASTIEFRNTGRLYNDACDAGIAIRSGQRVSRFYWLDYVQRDGEVVAWNFKPVDPKCAVHLVTIYND